MNMKIKTALAWIAFAAIFIMSASSIIWYKYSQEFVQDSNTTATKGIFMQKTLNLDVYKRVSSGNGWLGQYDRYSRSDRHQDVLTIYCKDFCKKK